MAAERCLSQRIPDSRVGSDIGKIDKKPGPSIYVPVKNTFFFQENNMSLKTF